MASFLSRHWHSLSWPTLSQAATSDWQTPPIAGLRRPIPPAPAGARQNHSNRILRITAKYCEHGMVPMVLKSPAESVIEDREKRSARFQKMSEAFHKAFLVVSVCIRGMARAAERAAEPQLFGARPTTTTAAVAWQCLATFGNVSPYPVMPETSWATFTNRHHIITYPSLLSCSQNNGWSCEAQLKSEVDTSPWPTRGPTKWSKASHRRWLSRALASG